MRSIFELSDWFLGKEKMQHKKLQKLCYYAVAWGYTILPEPICTAGFEAWRNGPVNPELYEKYKEYGFDRIPQNKIPPKFNEEEEDFMDCIWEIYGNETANSIEALVQSEAPWQRARLEVPIKEREERVSHVLVLPDDMKKFYKSYYTHPEGEQDND